MTRLIYIHVPKCGGSSFAAALRLRYLHRHRRIGFYGDAVGAGLSGEARIEADYALRRAALQRKMAAGVRCISGHVQADAAMIDARYRWVTLLRPPEERFVSHYAYLQRRHADIRRPADLAAFLDTPDAARIASQYLFYFAGVSQARAPDVGAAVARALSTLSRFALVGDLAAPDQFLHDLRRLCGPGVLRLHRNAAPAPSRVPHALRARIADLCAADRAIYDGARARALAA